MSWPSVADNALQFFGTYRFEDVGITGRPVFFGRQSGTETADVTALDSNFEGQDVRVFDGSSLHLIDGATSGARFEVHGTLTLEDTAITDQMKNGKTTLIEAMINQELGEPFRRDAMKTPVAVAGISADDMREQVV